METKLFEIRDRMTHIPAMATRFNHESANRSECYIQDRAGFAGSTEYIILTRLEGLQTEYDPYYWGDTRTMQAAHLELQQNWDKYTSGDVLDVRFVLGETPAPCKSDRFFSHGDL